MFCFVYLKYPLLYWYIGHVSNGFVCGCVLSVVVVLHLHCEPCWFAKKNGIRMFTLEELKEALRSKLTNNGKKTLHASERTFNTMTETLYERLRANGGDELKLEDVVSTYIGDYELIEGDMRKRSSNAAKLEREKAELEAEFEALKKRLSCDGEGDEQKSELEKMRDELQELKNKLTEDESRRKADAKRGELRKMLLEKIGKESWVDGQLSLLDVTEETDIEDRVTKLVALYNMDHEIDNLPPGNGGGKGKEEVDFSDVKESIGRSLF